MALRGLDTSNNNRGVPDATIAADFIIFKATEGVGYVDNDCAASYAEAKAAGKLLGVYDFARPDGNNAITEADFFLANVKGYVHEAVLILDWEHTPTDDVAYAKAWLDHVYAVTGVRPMIYMNTSTANAFNWSSVWGDYALWVAQYLDYVTDFNYDMSNAGSMPDVKWPNGYAMWQWTSSGRLNGYGGNLDCNIFYGDATAWHSFAKGAPVVAPPVVIDNSAAIAAAKAEADRVAAVAEAARLAKVESDRLLADKVAADKVEADRVAAAKLLAEQEAIDKIAKEAAAKAAEKAKQEAIDKATTPVTPSVSLWQQLLDIIAKIIAFMKGTK